LATMSSSSLPSAPPPSPSATPATATTTAPTTPLHNHRPAPSLLSGASPNSSPCLEELLLDYDSSPSPRSKTPKGSSQSPTQQDAHGDRTPTYKEVLLSHSPPKLDSHRPHKSQEAVNPAAAVQRPKQSSTVVRPEAAPRQHPRRGYLGRAAAVSVKDLGARGGGC
jgi:hypothetical protein